MSRASFLLREWGSWVCSNVDFADEYGESILYRCSQYGYTDPQPGDSVILCPDMPQKIKRIDNAVKRLPISERNVITLWYCSPLKQDGNPYEKGELSVFLGINKSKFNKKLRKGENRLKYLT